MGLCLTSDYGELHLSNDSISRYFIITTALDTTVARHEFIISGALIMTQAAYSEATLKVPGTSFHPASTVFSCF